MTTAHPVSRTLLSHESSPVDDIDALLQDARARLHAAGDLPYASVARQIALLEQLATFDLGRFLLKHRGLNGYWTHQLVSYTPDSGQAASMQELERWIVEKSPAVLATRERFGIFRQQVQALLRPGMVLASVPCGWMGELLLLEYGQQPDVVLVGIDLEQSALDGAQALAEEKGLAAHLTLRCEDAWNSETEDEFDVLTSNGLNIYEPDDARVVLLYRAFFRALKPGGTLVTSFLTPPPALSAQSPWQLAGMEQETLLLQHLLFTRVINAKWNTFRTHAQTVAQLGEAGFTDLRFCDDRACMFPTVIARKPL